MSARELARLATWLPTAADVEPPGSTRSLSPPPELRRSADLVAVAHFLALFGAHLGLPEPIPDVEILEREYVDPASPVVFAVHRAVLGRLLRHTQDVLLFTWQDRLREFEAAREPADAPAILPPKRDYASLSVAARPTVTMGMIHLLFAHDPRFIAHVDTLEPSSIRIERLGEDAAGNLYWNFADQRLYKEKQTLAASGEVTGSTWSTPCTLADEWTDLADKLAKSKHAGQQQLHSEITTVLLPAYREKLQQRQKSARVAQLAAVGLLKRSGRVQARDKHAGLDVRGGFLAAEQERYAALQAEQAEKDRAAAELERDLQQMTSREARLAMQAVKEAARRAAAVSAADARRAAAERARVHEQQLLREERDRRRQERVAAEELASVQREREQTVLPRLAAAIAALGAGPAGQRPAAVPATADTRYVFTSSVANDAAAAVERREHASLAAYFRRKVLPEEPRAADTSARAAEMARTSPNAASVASKGGRRAAAIPVTEAAEPRPAQGQLRIDALIEGDDNPLRFIATPRANSKRVIVSPKLPYSTLT